MSNKLLIFSTLVIVNFISYFVSKNEIHLILISFFYCFLVLLYGNIKKELNFKNSALIFGTSLIVFIIDVISGAFLTTYYRMFYELIVYGTYYFLLYKVYQKTHLFYYSILISFGISTIIFSVSCMKFGSTVFIPASLANIISFIVFFISYNLFIKYIFKYTFYFSVSIIISLLLYPQYIQKISGKKPEIKLTTKLIISDSLKSIVNIDTLNKDLIILDFWHSRCGACFEGFPNYQKFYDKYKNNSRVFIGVVNASIINLDNENTAFDLLRMYTFNKYKTELDMNQLDSIGVHSYPHVIVFDKNKKVRYQGTIHYNQGINNIDDIVDQILNEK